MLRVSLIVLLAMFSVTDGSAEERDIAVNQPPSIVITAPLTRLQVEGWDEDFIRLTADSLEHVVVEQSGGTVSIDAGDPPAVSFSILVPVSQSLVIHGELADITVQGVNGDVSVFTTNNPIRISQVIGSVDAKSFLAPVVVDDVDGDVRAESNRADVTLSGIRGQVWARTAGASVSLQNSISDRVELQTLNGGIRFDGVVGSQADYLLASHRGFVDVRLLEGSDVTAELNGKPELFSAGGTTLQPAGHRQSVAVIGEGNGKMVIQSPRGPIHLSAEQSD